VAGDLHVVRVRRDRLDDLLGPSALAHDPRADVQGGLLGRVLLVIEVVEQADDAPLLDLRRIGHAVPARVRAHGLLDAAGVLAQRIGLGELVEERDGVGAGLHPLTASAICWRAARTAGRSPPKKPMISAKMVAFTAMSGAK